MNHLNYNNFNKTQQFESANMQHQRYFKNSVMPGQQQYAKKNSHLFGNADNFYYNGNVNHPNGGGMPQFHPQAMQMNANLMGAVNPPNYGGNFGGGGGRQRFAPYLNKRSYANAVMQTANQQRHMPFGGGNGAAAAAAAAAAVQQQMAANALNMSDGSMNSSQSECMYNNGNGNGSNNSNGQSSNGNNSFVGMGGLNSTPSSGRSSGSVYESGTPNSSSSSAVTLQISNLDTTMDENDLKQYLINRLKPITSVLSIYFESLSVAKIKLQTEHQARQVITHLHRKKIGHKRITVSYTRESSTLDSSTLRCQVAGLLKVSGT